MHIKVPRCCCGVDFHNRFTSLLMSEKCFNLQWVNFLNWGSWGIKEGGCSPSEGSGRHSRRRGTTQLFHFQRGERRIWGNRRTQPEELRARSFTWTCQWRERRTNIVSSRKWGSTQKVLCHVCPFVLFALICFFNPIIAQFHSSPVMMCLNTLSSSPSLHKGL